MDVLSLDHTRFTPLAEKPGGRSPLTRLLRHWIELLAHARPGGADGPGSPSRGATAISRRTILLGYTTAQILVGLGLLAWVTTSVRIWPGIVSQSLDGTALAGTTGGVLLWTMFGLMASVRTVSSSEGSGNFTFHLPFVGAAMVLGGPTAGAWVAFLSTIDRRELESQPWYGILSNHTADATAAVVGGATYALVEQALLAATGDLKVAQFVAVLVAGLVLEGFANALALATIMIRDQLAAAAVLSILVDDFRRETILEISLIWVLVIATLTVGWWAPLAVGLAVIVLVRPVSDRIDELTGLMQPATFERRLERKIGWIRRGFLPGGAILAINANRFRTVNDQHGHAVGDEVLKVIAARIHDACPRHEDLIGRLKDDSFGVFFAGLTSPEVAMRKADEIVESVCRPIPTSVGPVSVGVSIGVHVEQAWGGVPSGSTLMRRAEQAMHIAKREDGECGGAHLYADGDATPFDEEWDSRP